MNYEQKYKKALERAKALYDNGAPDSLYLEEIFSEIRESEDEKIRKEIIYHIQNCDDTIDEKTEKRMIAWLEKQKVLSTEEELQGKEDVLWCIKQASKYAKDENEMGTCWLAEKWLEKQSEKFPSIIWHNINEEPEEMRELLCEWESNDATWHDVAFYHPDDKTFWNCAQQVEDVIRWCYIDDLHGLEKQDKNKSEQKLVNKVEPKFTVDDYVVRKDGSCFYGGSNYARITNIISGKYYFNTDTWEYPEEIRHWTINDAKDGDVLTTPNYIYIFNSIDKETKTVSYYCLMEKSDEHFSFGDYKIHDEILNSIPATQEQRKLLFQKIEEAGYKWDDDKLELKKIEEHDLAKDYVIKKTIWSEEDIKNFNRISAILVDASEVKNWWKEYRLIEKDEMIRLTDFIKSIKDRCIYKPIKK